MNLAQIGAPVCTSIVVIDVPDVSAMFLSRNWVVSIGGNIQIDISFATIPTSKGTFVTLYREPTIRYQVEDPNDPLMKSYMKMINLET